MPIPPEGVRFRSQFSNILVREEGNARTLIFIDDEGREHVESRMDTTAPERLEVPYTRSMFVSYLFVPEPKRVLLIGVGAGSMLRFLRHHEPALQIDGVDIDPVVLDVARDYFGTRPDDALRLIAADGLRYVEETEQRYDVIYLDAFLKPSAGTDRSGVPAHLKTVETYRRMQQKLAPSGVVVINLHRPTLDADVPVLRQAFASGHLFRVPGTGNYVLVGSSRSEAFDAERLTAVGRGVDERLRAPFSIAAFTLDLEAR